MTGWQASATTRVFEIPEGTILGGFADRAGRSTGTHDALEIDLLRLQSNGQDLVLIGADIVAVDRDLVLEIARAAGISPRSIVLAATHTHSGPLGVPHRLHPASPPTGDPALRERFVALATEALLATQDTSCQVTIDSGDISLPGIWANRNDPNESSDDRIRFLAVRRTDDGVLAALVVLLPCHPTVLGVWNCDVSADLHGAVRRSLRNLMASDIPILMLTGAAGDISTRYTRQDSSFAELDRLGAHVAHALLPALPECDPVTPSLARAHGQVMLQTKHVDPGAASQALDEANAAWARLSASPEASEGERRQAWTRKQGAEIQARLASIPPEQAEIGAWRLGDDLAIVTIPGEPFSSLGQAIERASPFRKTWVIGYANGYHGYLVDAAALMNGTYEALASPWSSAASDLVIDKSIELLHQFK